MEKFMKSHQQDLTLSKQSDSSLRYKRELPNKNNLPSELLELAQFVGWKLHEKGEGVKPAKVPLNPKTGEFASTALPSTWGTLQEAEQLFESNPDVIGLGFMLSVSDPYVGIDLDNCVDSDGVIEPWAAEDIDCLDSYTELSPSKRGIRIFVKGSLDGLKGRRRGPREIYSEGRYLTLTGDVIRPRLIEPRNSALRELHSRWYRLEQGASAAIPVVHQQTWERPFTRTSEKIKRLLNGDTSDYASRSEADLALCSYFAWKTKGDAQEIDELFKSSPLYRQKWEERRGQSTYGAMTIQKSLEQDRGIIPAENRRIEESNAAWRLTHRKASEITPAQIDWLWEGVLPKGKLVLLAGKGGLGKSQVSLSIAAIVTTGGRFPGGDKPCEPGRAVILSAEDDAADTIVPRLKAVGANLDKIHILDDMKRDAANGRENERSFRLDTDISHLEEIFTEFQDIQLLILDPISSYLGSMDSHKNSQVRSLLAPLTQIAQRHAVTIVCITHLNKGDSTHASDRVMGSAAFVNAVRTGFIVTADKEDQGRRKLAPIKNNLALDRVGYAYRIKAATVTHENEIFNVSKVAWESDSFEITADDALGQFEPTRGGSRFEAAKAFLLQALEAGPMRATDLEALAEEEGHALPTIRRARAKLGCLPDKTGGGFGAGEQYWEWSLPDPQKVITEE
jgi:putative DNA primase/helicase